MRGITRDMMNGVLNACSKVQYIQLCLVPNNADLEVLQALSDRLGDSLKALTYLHPEKRANELMAHWDWAIPFTNIAISPFRAIVRLSIMQCAVTDDTLDIIAKKCQRLQFLRIWETKGFSDKGIEALFRSCSALKEVGFCRHQASWDTLQLILDLRLKLQLFELGSCKRESDFQLFEEQAKRIGLLPVMQFDYWPAWMNM